MDNTDGLTSSHGISKVSANRVSDSKSYSDYIKNNEFETMKVFEIRNDSGTRLNQMTRPDQNISRINPVSRINPDSRIKYPIRPTFNIQLTRPTESA